jgi:hypothetical protein
LVRVCLFVRRFFLPVRSLSLRLRFVRFCVSLSDRVLPCTTLYYPVLPCTTTLYYPVLPCTTLSLCRSVGLVVRVSFGENGGFVAPLPRLGLFVCSFAASLLCRLARRFEPSPGLVPRGSRGLGPWCFVCRRSGTRSSSRPPRLARPRWYMHVCISYAYAHTRTSAHTRTRTHTHAHTHTHKHAHTHAHTRAHSTHTHTRAHARTRTHEQSALQDGGGFGPVNDDVRPSTTQSTRGVFVEYPWSTRGVPVEYPWSTLEYPWSTKCAGRPNVAERRFVTAKGLLHRFRTL